MKMIATSESLPPPPLLFIETVGSDGEAHKRIVQTSDEFPAWFSKEASVRVIAPNGARREGKIKVDIHKTNFYEACRSLLGSSADWMPSLPEKKKAQEPDHDCRVWIDGKPSDIELGRLAGKFIKFNVPLDASSSYFEVSNDKGPKIFAPIDRNIFVYIDILKGKTGDFLCPRVLTNFTFPAALWAFRRVRISDAAEVAAVEVANRCKEGEDRIDWVVAAGQSVILYPDRTESNRSKVVKALSEASSKSPDAEICLALIRMMDMDNREEAYSVAKKAVINLARIPPRYACTMEVLDANVDVLAELFRADGKAEEALSAVRLLVARVRASFGRGDVNVFRGNSPTEPDSTAVGESGSKKKSSLIEDHFASRVEAAALEKEPAREKAAVSIDAGAPTVRSQPVATASPRQRANADRVDGTRRRDKRERFDGRNDRGNEFVDKLVHINRVAKVVKGGKRFGFAALVVIGDQKGRVGFGHGKAREVPEAIRKATAAAQSNLTRVPLREGRTLHHDIAGRHGAGKVYLRSAPPGTGIIAGGPMRAVFETLGIRRSGEVDRLIQSIQHGSGHDRCA